ncbi:hypothetical protein AGABI1DRAFT_70288 [Agaricus bisporus var. burnettii JB137-S8]|uniref:Uncharacterized protein n=2 Tax=Agaricus bisporus var. burnettii TaxID=192524 RepID=K5XEK3_AGABU|nr:uncharacterized protein AGABI1DRAFT_70288 [Agaricus bisporus var. burnettii JB137-S8]EKM81813.1 hypothetical protein AGABI1DRAFT_70288 [Agaricus bisporus var. burnettii JB137-S8]KAF7770491.1 hypothetical protein Agabi119p4_6465 [Agaricus bisporus var. burnettii]
MDALFDEQHGSRRWLSFRAALQLAIERSSRKWTFQDFTECFPTYVEKEEKEAQITFKLTQDYIEKLDKDDIIKLFQKYHSEENVDIPKNIDILHKLVREAEARKESGEISNSVWREDRRPRNAHMIPFLESQVAQLRENLAKREEKNRQLQAQLEEDINARDEAYRRQYELLQKLDNSLAQFEKLPMNAIEDWTVQTANTLKQH